MPTSPVEVELEEHGVPSGSVDERRRTSSRSWAVLAGVGLAVAATIVVVSSLDGHEPESSARRRVPTASELRWQVELDATGVEWVTATSNTVFVVTGDGDHLFALERSSGAVRWDVELARGPNTLEVIDGVVLLAMESAESTRVLGLDVATGAERWSRQLEGDAYPSVFEEDVYLHVFADGSWPLELLDPSTGLTLETWPAGTWLTEEALVVREGDDVEVRDLDSDAVLASIDASGTTADEPVPVVMTDVGVVTATAEGIVLLRDGRTVATLEHSVKSTHWWLRELDGSTVLASGDEEVRVLDVSAEGFTERWSRRGWPNGVVRHGDRTLVVVTGIEDRGREPSGRVDVVNGDGQVVWSGDAEPWAGDGVMPMDDGFVVVSDDAAGYGPEGERLWQREFDEEAETFIVDRGVVTVATDLASATTTVSLRG